MYTTFKYIFTFSCSVVTLLLISQLFFTFVAERPTITSKLERDLEKSDLPDVVLCMDPGLNDVTLNDRGYWVTTYYRGAEHVNSSQFIGWNGKLHENKSSHQILKEALLLPNDEALLKFAGYRESQKNYEKAVVTFKTLGNHIGRCMFISPTLSLTNPNRLEVHFNSSLFTEYGLYSFKFKIYFLDRANSAQLYPDKMMMMGDPIVVQSGPNWYSYQTKISKSEHVQGDPLFDCALYNKHDSYDKCIRKDLERLFEKELGCQPPYLSENISTICDKKFNVSENRSSEIFNIFLNLYYADKKFRCKPPCTKLKYTTRDKGVWPDQALAFDITFDKTIETTLSRFNIDWKTLLTKLGGFIGIGRSFLWVLVSLLGTAQVIKIF